MNIVKYRWRSCTGVQRVLLFSTLLYASFMMAQSPAPRTPERPAPSAADATPISDEDLAVTREQLFKLLRLSPKLTGVVANDPSLLGNQEYVSRNNPELAKFLATHPEIARNPEFYLFASFEGNGKHDRRLSLERGVVSLELPRDPSVMSEEILLREMVPALIFFCCAGALLWIVRLSLENRRWSRLFKAQTDIYNKLLDRFGNNEELLAYVRDDAGKRFLESLALPSSLWSFSRNPITRILAPLQLGVVLTLAGIGLLWVRGSVPDATSALTGALLIFGTLVLMLGIGFIISAGLSFMLARHLGLISPAGSAPHGNSAPEAREL